MKKGMISGLCVLFVFAILTCGCNKSEEKKAAAPIVEEQTLEQQTTPVQE